MKTIPVPKPPASAFNPNRPAGTLLTSQVMQLEWALRPATQRQPKDFKRVKPPKTEREAARRIAALTKRLHPIPAKAATVKKGAAGSKSAKRKKNPKGRPKRRAGKTRGRR